MTKSLKDNTVQAKKVINDQFVLAALSIPLNSKVNNFERLSFSYLPASMKDFDEANIMAREEQLEMARMLQVEGYPTRQSVIHYITMENIHSVADEHVGELYYLIEQEDSPFVISRKGKAALDALCESNPSLA